MGILELQNLNLNLGGKNILNNVTVDFWEGHIHAIVGPNGAGKSTLASTIMGLSGYTDPEGKILFRGENITPLHLDERARKGISLGWQEPARFEGLKAVDFIKACAKDKSESAIAGTLEAVGLDPEEYLSRSVDKTLSGGERKRIELASILAMAPAVVLLDEPDSGIDVEALNKIYDAIRLLKNNGSTVILITHSLSVLQQADHAFLMCCGEIFDKGAVDKIAKYFENKCLPCTHKNVPDIGEIENE